MWPMSCSDWEEMAFCSGGRALLFGQLEITQQGMLAVHGGRFPSLWLALFPQGDGNLWGSECTARSAALVCTLSYCNKLAQEWTNLKSFNIFLFRKTASSFHHTLLPESMSCSELHWLPFRNQQSRILPGTRPRPVRRALLTADTVNSLR